MIRQILVGATLTLAFLGAVRIAIQPVPAKAVDMLRRNRAAQSLREDGGYWSHLWTSRVPDCRSLSLSPDGRSIAWTDSRGSVRRIDAGTGKTLWQTKPQDAASSVIALADGAILSYSLLNPAAPFVRVFHPRWGERHKEALAVGSPLWSVSRSPDGQNVFVGAGDRTVHSLRAEATTGKHLVRRLWQTPGIPETITISRAGQTAVGTTMAAGIAYRGVSPQSEWSFPEEQSARRSRVHLSEDGNTLIDVTAVGPREQEARVTVWDPTGGQLLWTRDLNGFRPRCAVSADGDVIAIAYEALQVYRTGPVRERRLLLFQRDGRQIAPPLGSTFFGPELVGVARDGDPIVVRDAVGCIHTLRRDGTSLSRLRPKSEMRPMPLNDVQISRDGSALLVWRGSQISLYRVDASREP